MRAPTNYYSQIVANEQQIPKLFNSILIEFGCKCSVAHRLDAPYLQLPKIVLRETFSLRSLIKFNIYHLSLFVSHKVPLVAI